MARIKSWAIAAILMDGGKIKSKKVDLPIGSTVDDAIDRMISILQDATRK